MIKTVTIDFWNTLFDSSNGEARKRHRNSALRKAMAGAGKPWDEEEVTAAFKHVYEAFERRWFGEQKTMNASESLDVMWDFFGVRVGRESHAEVVKAFEESILHGMPAPLPGAAEALAALASRRRLALISDTAFSPGCALRQVMRHFGIDRHFAAMVFSDETGVSKPHPRAFATALEICGSAPCESAHIGDIERTDIAGAKQAGMKAMLFRGGAEILYADAGAPTQADHVIHTWSEAVEILQGL